MLFFVLTIVLNVMPATKVSGQTLPYDFYVNEIVSMSNDAIAFYTVNMTLGPKAINALRESNWALKIQLPKWSTPKIVRSIDMPALLLADGKRIQARLENEMDYDYVVFEIPPISSDSLNATLRIGFVQRDDITGNSIAFNLPILTGFNIVPEYVNFTFKTSGRIESYSQYLVYFNPILEDNMVVGLWNTYIRPTSVKDIAGSVYFSEPFEKCVIESLQREIRITEQLQVTVTDRLRVRYIGGGSTSEILKTTIPTSISNSIKAKDSLGPLQTYASEITGTNMSIVRIYSRYSLKPGQEYEAILEYNIPIKSVITSVNENTISILLKNLGNYSDIVSTYSLNVKVESIGDWKLIADSVVVGVERDGVFVSETTNAMPSILIQPLSITFTHAQIEAGRSISIILGLLTLFILMVLDTFREKAIKPVEELKEEKEMKNLIEKILEALHEKIDYESRLEETKIKNTLGKLSSKEYRTITEEYERRITGAEKRIIKAIEQISSKNSRIGEEVKKNYDIFEEINNDLKKMVDNTIERFRSGRITRSMFESLAEKYLKENKKRRESTIEDVYRPLEKLRP